MEHNVTSLTATDNTFTLDIDNDLDIESVDMKDVDNDTYTPREQTSVHVDEITPQETEPVKLGTPKRTKIRFYRMKTQTLRTPCVFIAFEHDDNEKPPTKEMRMPVLEDAHDQTLQEPGSVEGRL